MPTQYDIEIIRGKPFSSQICAKDDDGVPLDLTAYTFSGWLQLDATGIHYPFTTQLSIPASGIVNLEMPVYTSSGLFITEYLLYVDANHTGDSNNSIRLLQGYAEVYP